MQGTQRGDEYSRRRSIGAKSASTLTAPQVRAAKEAAIDRGSRLQLPYLRGRPRAQRAPTLTLPSHENHAPIMSGSVFSLSIEAIAGKNGSAEELYAELYSVIETNVRRLAKGKGYRQVTEEYLETATEDGAGRSDAIDFVFADGAGLCEASAHACDHWFRLFASVLSTPSAEGAPSPLDLIAASHGFELVDELPSTASLLDDCKAPSVLVRGHLCGTGKLGSEVFLVSDDLEDGALRMGDLKATEREAVEAAVHAGRCECRIRAGLRDPAFAPKLPKKARASR